MGISKHSWLNVKEEVAYKKLLMYTNNVPTPLKS